MAEMPHAGEHHRHAVFIRRRDHFCIAHAAAGLDHGGDAGCGSLIDAITERKESIRRQHGSVERQHCLQR